MTVAEAKEHARKMMDGDLGGMRTAELRTRIRDLRATVRELACEVLVLSRKPKNDAGRLRIAHWVLDLDLPDLDPGDPA